MTLLQAKQGGTGLQQCKLVLPWQPVLCKRCAHIGHSGLLYSDVSVSGAQIVGAILGALLEVALVPGLHWGHHTGGVPVPGCFPPPPPTLNNYQIFGWTTYAVHCMDF